MVQDEEFMKRETADANAAMQQLAALISYVREKYACLPADELLQYPAQGKWSKQQVLGHLIDSALNNLKRFTDAQIMEQPYVIIGYEQNELMVVNNYQQLPLQHLLGLWEALNQQIMYVVQMMQADALALLVRPQNDQGTQTLEWLICDYVAHMKHHLRGMSFLN